MAKVTYKDVSGTSFHNTIITTTVTELKKLIGNPYGNNTGEDKVNFVWDCETKDGDVFTIYDWKEYREISEDEPIEFHIGAISKKISEQAKQEINDKRN